MVEAAIANHTPAVPATGGRFAFLSAGKLSIATVNRILSFLTVVVFAYFVAMLFLGTVKLLGVGHHIRTLETKGAQASAQMPSQGEFVKAKPAGAELSNRNIFQPAGAFSTRSDASAPASHDSAYRLVGLSLSKDSAETYVMIENTQSKLTYFLQYGQPVEGLELEKILEDKVIVKIGGKSVELE